MSSQMMNGCASPEQARDENPELVEDLYREAYPGKWVVDVAVDQRGYPAAYFEAANARVSEERLREEARVIDACEAAAIRDEKPSEPRKTEALEYGGWPKRHLRQLANPDFTLGSLGEEQHRAYVKAIEAALNTDGDGRMLVLLGRRGTGKTLLATIAAWNARVAWQRERLASYTWGSNGFTAPASEGYAPMSPGKDSIENSKCYYVLGDLFMQEKASFKLSGATSPISEAMTAPLLVLDEIQERSVTEWQDTELTRLIDHRYRAMLPTVFIGNLAAKDLPKFLGSSIISRLQEVGEIIECNWKSYRRQG